jgi:hypothetical protein
MTDVPGHEEHGGAGEGGHGDDHHDMHAEGSLGPLDWNAWGAAALGVGVAAFVALLMAFASGVL